MSVEEPVAFSVTPSEKYRLLDDLSTIAQSLDRLAEQGPTTPLSVFNQTVTSPAMIELTEIPPSEVPAQGNDTEIVLPDGRTVPTAAVRALAVYGDTTWPDAVRPEARAAVVWTVLSAVETEKEEAKEPVLRTNYPFCLEPNPDPLESPCILRADHRSPKHADNNDGTWSVKE
jgi:hypothetical protein